MERLTDVTKRDIFEMFRDGIMDSKGPFDIQIKYPYNGRLDEIEFLERLGSCPSEQIQNLGFMEPNPCNKPVSGWN